MLQDQAKQLASLDEEEQDGLEFIHQAKVEALAAKKLT